jgi:MFS family permease
MGALGGIIVLILGMIFGTGESENALMSYTPFFAVIVAIMLISLIIFKFTVNEPKFAREMQEESLRLGLDEVSEEDEQSGSRKLSKKELTSLFLILASVVLWFMGYNAVTSKYSIYASAVLGLDYNITLTIASGAAIVSYLPIGIISSKIGRKKTLMGGIILLGTAFLVASFMRSGSSVIVMNLLFMMAGIGWATISVNSYPMVVELSRGGEVGKYTGFYYTASMAAQTATPILSGFFMDMKMTSLFIYATIFVFLAFFTMLFVKHGDSSPKAAEAKK